jgi:hypothetical protein
MPQTAREAGKINAEQRELSGGTAKNIAMFTPLPPRMLAHDRLRFVADERRRIRSMRSALVSRL